MPDVPNVLVFPGPSANDVFVIDRSDYEILRQMLKNPHALESRNEGLDTRKTFNIVRDMVEIRDDDRERKVCKLRFPRNIQHIGPQLGSLTHLMHLSLAWSCSPTIPATIGRLKNLKELNLCGMKNLTHLPEEIGNVASLEILNLAISGITQLPDEIGCLGKLKSLNLQLSSISSLPSSFGRLRSLQDLDLSFAKELTRLPEEIGTLTKLKKLNLRWSTNFLFPSFFGRLQNLQDLDLGSYCFTSLPPSIWKLRNLERLDLSDSNLREMPTEIGNLTNMRILDLWESYKITSLPDSIGRLKGLEILRLSPEMMELPDEIWNLSNLKFLDFGETHITPLLDSQGRLQSPVCLRIGRMCIASLSDSLGRLQSLMYLNINVSSQSVQAEDLKNEFLLKTIQSLPLLRSIGPNAYGRKVGFALACNRARLRMPFGKTKKDESNNTTLTKLWPHMLQNAARAFDPYPLLDDLCPPSHWSCEGQIHRTLFKTEQEPEMKQEDAIHKLLVDGRESFIGAILLRDSKAVSNGIVPPAFLTE